MIHVLATIEVMSGRRADFLNEFQLIVPLVQAEDGCIEYGPAIDVGSDIDAQSPVRENSVTVIEKWRDLAALQAHLAANHMNDYRERVKDLVVNVELRILEPA